MATQTDVPYSSETSIKLSLEQLRSFRDAVDTVILRCRESTGTADVQHVIAYGVLSRLVVALGLALAAWHLNPVSPFLVAVGWMSRWGLAHQILHRSYDSIAGRPTWLSGSIFARGWRRYWDWCDWIVPDAWYLEHNIHHVNTGGAKDPDVVEANLEFLRQAKIPRWRKILLALLIMGTWRLTYYAPSTFIQLRRTEQGLAPTTYTITSVFMFAPTFNPLSAEGRRFWRRCLLPYTMLRFVALPLAFAPFGWAVWLKVLTTLAIAEVVFNVYSWVIIASSHTADDIFRFAEEPKGKDVWYLHQVLGTSNYLRGPGLRDWAFGWINYQIEHHLCPNLTLRQLEAVSPAIKLACESNGIIYLSDSLWRRFWRMFHIVIGDSTMPKFGSESIL